MKIEDWVFNMLKLHGNTVVRNKLIKDYGKRKVAAEISKRVGFKVRIETHVVDDDSFIPLNHQSKRKGPQIGYAVYRVQDKK